MNKNIYLDNASTHKMSDAHIEYLKNIIGEYGNPSSSHSIGDKARYLVEYARNNVAKFINANVDNIYFTPSGSASNTLAVKGFVDANSKRYDISVMYSPISHKSIINCINEFKNTDKLKVNRYGEIDIHDLEKKLQMNRYDKCLSLVIVDYANSEIGTIQNVKKIIDIVHKHYGVVYLDCTASIPHIELDVNDLDVDMIGFSGHKLGSLKGVGVLYKKKHIVLKPLIYGSQEKGLIGGTYNTLSIASLGYIVENYKYDKEVLKKTGYLLNGIFAKVDDCYLVGSLKNRLDNNINICIKDVDSDYLVTTLDKDEIQVSKGSACNNHSPAPSHVLKEIGLSDKDAGSCIRMTLSGDETYEELNYVIDVMSKWVRFYRALKS